jgi:isopentenyl-diphosphate delta-isomerase
MDSIAEHVILVDVQDRPIGTMEKLQAHQRGALHRAFSIFVFNSHGHMLLQRRAFAKYHTGGLWSNTCCSHPRPGQKLETELLRKLHQEMGFQCSLDAAFTFTYRSELDNKLVEYELDHVYIGHYDGTPLPNPHEVSEWRYASIGQIANELQANPNRFTPWFRLLFAPITEHYTLGKRA